MSFFTESEGKVYIGKDDPEPVQCPDCRKVFELKKVSKAKIRCPHCQYQGESSEFKGRFVEIAVVRVLVAV